MEGEGCNGCLRRGPRWWVVSKKEKVKEKGKRSKVERGQRSRDGRQLKNFLSIPIAFSHGILWDVCVVCLPETQRQGITLDVRVWVSTRDEVGHG